MPFRPVAPIQGFAPDECRQHRSKVRNHRFRLTVDPDHVGVHLVNVAFQNDLGVCAAVDLVEETSQTPQLKPRQVSTDSNSRVRVEQLSALAPVWRTGCWHLTKLGPVAGPACGVPLGLMV